MLMPDGSVKSRPARTPPAALTPLLTPIPGASKGAGFWEQLLLWEPAASPGRGLQKQESRSCLPLPLSATVPLVTGPSRDCLRVGGTWFAGFTHHVQGWLWRSGQQVYTYSSAGDLNRNFAEAFTVVQTTHRSSQKQKRGIHEATAALTQASRGEELAGNAPVTPCER